MKSVERFYLARFRKFQKRYGEAFVWAKLYGPYDGCFYKHVLLFINGNDAFMSFDLKGTSYAHFLKPGYRFDNRYMRAGYVDARAIDRIFGGEKVEYHTFDELQANTPHAVVANVLSILEELGIDPHRNERFICPSCDMPIYVGDELHYLKSESKGDGGVGIEVGAPIHLECYYENHNCSYCGEEVDQYGQDLEYEGEYRCIYCIPQQVCPVCHEEIRLSWGNEDEVEEWRRSGCCHDCAQNDPEAVEAYLEKVRQEGLAIVAAAHTGDLFAGQ